MRVYRVGGNFVVLREFFVENFKQKILGVCVEVESVVPGKIDFVIWT